MRLQLSGRVINFLNCHYGLKHAGREWYLLLVKWRAQMMKPERCKAEPCIFREMANDKFA